MRHGATPPLWAQAGLFVAALAASAPLVAVLLGAHVAALLCAPFLAVWRSLARGFRRGEPCDSVRVNLVRSKAGSGGYPYLVRAINHLPIALLGPSSLLLMVLEPQVAMAVNVHSTYFDDPVRRLLETLKLVLSMTVEDELTQKRAIKYIHRKHAAIHGEGYSAESQVSQLFVWSCLVLNVEKIYRVANPETHKDALDPLLDEIYHDWKNWAMNFGIQQNLIPATRTQLAHFHDQHLLQHGQPACLASRSLLRGLFGIPYRWFLLPLLPINAYFALVSIGFLPCRACNGCPELAHSLLSWLSFNSFKFVWWNTPFPVRRSALWLQNGVGQYLLPLPSGA